MYWPTEAKKAERASEDFATCFFSLRWFSTFWLSDDMRILSPSARQSGSLFVQGLRKVSMRSLAVLFCLSMSFATSSPSCRRVFWVGMAGWELSKLPAASHASCLAVTRRDGRHSTQLVKSTLMLGRGGKKRKKSHFYFALCPSSANFTGSKRVAPINDCGPEAAPALAQEQHVSSVGWHHARPASLPTLKQMKWD